MAMTKEEFMERWEGNRRLTIRTVEAFAEEPLFNYTPTEGLRPFSAMMIEILIIEKAYMQGIALDHWEFTNPYENINTKEELLKACEEVREETRTLWPSISPEHFSTVKDDPFFGSGEQRHIDRFLYALENENHHRGQGFIYLRMLGIEPPAFYLR
ncbi:DinB family protein [Aureibacillus halotolerans]|uniref:Putative damage-inducible protein DinB n=1 Tax=Aureibacillus halotolerans TaxID=1508390 RepID=A0A4R6TSS4_9BACI|nr:DinB family protein [Aureibacillus halotolerans]TDQ36116.1 putative damage-inducible protein DinB [Aureibacillus halotolerans]